MPKIGCCRVLNFEAYNFCRLDQFSSMWVDKRIDHLKWTSNNKNLYYTKELCLRFLHIHVLKIHIFYIHLYVHILRTYCLKTWRAIKTCVIWGQVGGRSLHRDVLMGAILHKYWIGITLYEVKLPLPKCRLFP